jgi:hypothetical protein
MIQPRPRQARQLEFVKKGQSGRAVREPVPPARSACGSVIDDVRQRDHDGGDALEPAQIDPQYRNMTPTQSWSGLFAFIARSGLSNASMPYRGFFDAAFVGEKTTWLSVAGSAKFAVRQDGYVGRPYDLVLPSSESHDPFSKI